MPRAAIRIELNVQSLRGWMRELRLQFGEWLYWRRTR
jgi:hypothetical protein